MDIRNCRNKKSTHTNTELDRSNIPDFREAANRFARFNHAQKESSLIFRGRRTTQFFTEDSHRYITPIEYHSIRQGVKYITPAGRWDGVCARVVTNYHRRRGVRRPDVLLKSFYRRYEALRLDIESTTESMFRSLSPHRMWNVSMIAAVLVGMVSMSLIYRFLGPGANAETDAITTSPTHIEQLMDLKPQNMGEGVVLGAETQKTAPVSTNEYWERVLNSMDIKSEDDRQQEKFEATVGQMVEGYPIEKMLPYIFEKDRTVASFLVSIAKKESNWGKRVPVLDGQDCFNYWGYRGIRRLMGTGGHTCFNSRKDAIDTVAKRIETLITKNNLDTPAKMIIWKCGSSCAAHNSYDVKKWISDVELYYEKINQPEE